MNMVQKHKKIKIRKEIRRELNDDRFLTDYTKKELEEARKTPKAKYIKIKDIWPLYSKKFSISNLLSWATFNFQ